MTRFRLLAIFSTAFVLYVLSSSIATGATGPVEAVGFAIAAWMALRGFSRVDSGTREGVSLARALSSAVAVVLASLLARNGSLLMGEVLSAATLPLVAILALELGLRFPDVPPRLLRHVRTLPILWALALIVAGLGVFSALPPLTLGRRALIAPAWVSDLPSVFAAAALCLVCALRVFRARLGSDARALAENTWAGAGIAFALIFGLSAYVLLWVHAPRELWLSAVTGASLSLVLGHALMVDSARALHAAKFTRRAAALAMSIAALTPIAMAVAPEWPTETLLRVSGVVLIALLFEGLRLIASRIVETVLAPDQGRLLAALHEISATRGSLLSVDDLAARVLRPLRRAARLPEASPVLFVIHPPREVRLDAAGEPRVVARAIPHAIASHWQDHGRVSLLRDDLVARLVRRPELRELVQALDLHDALIAVPLVCDGEVEGALIVARGARRTRVTLEEVDALEATASGLAGQLAVLLSGERAHARAHAAMVERDHLGTVVDDLKLELSAAKDRGLLLERALTATECLSPVVAYSAAMRNVIERVQAIAPHSVPLFLWTEGGTPLLPLARLAHRQSARASGPFILCDALSLAPDRAHAALSGEGNEPGLIELSEGGTLFVSDVASLSLSAQDVLVELLSERRVRSASSVTRFADVRLVVTSRLSPSELVASEVLRPELARWLEPAAVRVPPLRERREDLESLVLFAVDRAARALGKPTPGIAPDVLQALSAHPWPGNQLELEAVLERAVAHATAQRIALSDLPALHVGTARVPGSFLDQEREILRRALEQAGGNKTRAARALGLKRTALIDKLRRHGLDEPSGPPTH